MMDIDGKKAAALLTSSQRSRGVVPAAAADGAAATEDAAAAAAAAAGYGGPTANGASEQVFQWADSVRSAAIHRSPAALSYRQLVEANVQWLQFAAPSDVRVWWDQLSCDLRQSQSLMKEQRELLLTLLTQGLLLFNTFLFIMLSVDNSALRRALLVACFVSAIPVGMGCGLYTSALRAQGTIVLAESARHINAVLGVADAIDTEKTGWRWSLHVLAGSLMVRPRPHHAPQRGVVVEEAAPAGYYEQM